MARRIRWQIVIAVLSALLVAGLLGRLALRSASVASPLAGGSYSEALLGVPQQPIPLLNNPLADPTGRALGALLFDGLMRIGADGRIEPALAASYQLDATGEVYTFNLRRDVRWHDGQPFTADDVVFTLRSLPLATEPGEPELARFWEDVLVDRIDDYTVRATLNAPYAPLLSMARVPILPAHLLAGSAPDEWDGTPFAQQLVGTGPYRLAELRDDRAVLEANADYFGGRPYIERFELRFLATPEGALAALTRGDFTAYGERSGASMGGTSLPGNLNLAAVPLDEYAVLSFNLREQPLSEVALRRALAHGLSKDALIERALGGLAQPLDTPILPGWWAYSPEQRWYEADRAQAELLLGELGYELAPSGLRERDGQPLRLELLVDGEPRRLAVAQEIARQWGELGIQIELQQLDGPALQQRLQARRFTLALHSWTRLGPDPDPFALWHSTQATQGLNYAGLDDEQLDDLLAAAREEQAEDTRSADYAAFQERWVELVPSITLYQPLYLFAAERRLGLGEAGLDDPNSNAGQILFGPEDRYRAVSRWYTDGLRAIEGDLR